MLLFTNGTLIQSYELIMQEFKKMSTKSTSIPEV